MDIKELKEKKEQLETEIEDIINDFEEKTGTSITSLQMSEFAANVFKGTTLKVIKVEVKII